MWKFEFKHPSTNFSAEFFRASVIPLHIQRPKRSVVASSRKVIVTTFRRGAETSTKGDAGKRRSVGVGKGEYT